MATVKEKYTMTQWKPYLDQDSIEQIEQFVNNTEVDAPINKFLVFWGTLKPRLLVDEITQYLGEKHVTKLHSSGNLKHVGFHFKLSKLSKLYVIEDLIKVPSSLIKQLLSREEIQVRPPYGSYENHRPTGNIIVCVSSMEYIEADKGLLARAHIFHIR
jgi:hypothetical protein